MSGARIVSLLLAVGACAPAVHAHPGIVPATPAGPLSVSVEIDGQPSPLYLGPDGSGRYYLEARRGRHYSIELANSSGSRLGVVLTVDGLNAISGARDEGRGRMYVLDPWQRTRVAGWRTSLQEVREFDFVDEQASYAARSGKANAKMGWIELAVYRERQAFVRQPQWLEEPLRRRSAEPAPTAAPEGSTRDDAEPPASPDQREAAKGLAAEGARSYPGTGWGRPAHDPAVLVHFEPEDAPFQTVTLRYEYRAALVALGVLPHHAFRRDRLSEREQAVEGFAPPPLR